MPGSPPGGVSPWRPCGVGGAAPCCLSLASSRALQGRASSAPSALTSQGSLAWLPLNLEVAITEKAAVCVHVCRAVFAPAVPVRRQEGETDTGKT